MSVVRYQSVKLQFSVSIVAVMVVDRLCVKSIGMATDRQDVQGYKVVIRVTRKGVINDMK